MLLRYHGFNNWHNYMLNGENVRDTILFGFELEVTRDLESSNFVSPERLAEMLHDEFGDLFVYERDCSIGEGVEIISNPMSMGYYKENIHLFKRLLELCSENGYCSTKYAKCGLHIHFSRSALGLNYNEYSQVTNCSSKNKNVSYYDNLKYNQTLQNINTIMEFYKDEMTSISGRNQNQLSRWCKFDNNDGSDVKSIKKTSKKKGEYNNDRYKVVNHCNRKTVEIRINRGTLNWDSFNTRINLMYNVVNVARNYIGLCSLKKIVEYNNDNETIAQMRKYIELNPFEYRRVDLNDKSKRLTLSMDTEFRVESVDFGKVIQDTDD